MCGTLALMIVTGLWTFQNVTLSPTITDLACTGLQSTTALTIHNATGSFRVYNMSIENCTGRWAHHGPFVIYFYENNTISWETTTLAWQPPACRWINLSLTHCASQIHVKNISNSLLPIASFHNLLCLGMEAAWPRWNDQLRQFNAAQKQYQPTSWQAFSTPLVLGSVPSLQLLQTVITSPLVATWLQGPHQGQQQHTTLQLTAPTFNMSQPLLNYTVLVVVLQGTGWYQLQPQWSATLTNTTFTIQAELGLHLRSEGLCQQLTTVRLINFYSPNQTEAARWFNTHVAISSQPRINAWLTQHVVNLTLPCTASSWEPALAVWFPIVGSLIVVGLVYTVYCTITKPNPHNQEHIIVCTAPWDTLLSVNTALLPTVVPPPLTVTQRILLGWVCLLTIFCFAMSNASAAADIVLNDVPLYSFSLASSVRDMWASKAYVLALGILCFSGIWPYIKMAGLLFFLGKNQYTHWSLQWLDYCGKFALLDSMVLALMMAAFTLTVPLGGPNNTLSVLVVIQPGFYLFLIGTVSSILLGTVIAHKKIIQPAPKNDGQKITSIVLIALFIVFSGFFFVTLFLNPLCTFVYTGSVQPFLPPIALGLAQYVLAAGPLTAIVLIIVICVAPFLQILTACTVVGTWIRPWAALDVFGLALLISLFQLPQFTTFLIGDKCTGLEELTQQPCFGVHTTIEAEGWYLCAMALAQNIIMGLLFLVQKGVFNKWCANKI